MVVHKLRVITAALLFSTGGTAIKFSSFTAWQIASFRSAIAVVLLTLLMPHWRTWWRPQSLMVGAAFGATLVLFVTANTLTTAANAIFLQYSAPLYILILGPKLLGEANRPRDFALMAVLATGILLLFFGQQAAVGTAPDPAVGNLFGLAAGVTWALTIMGLRWLALQPGVTNANGTAVVAGNAIACLVCLPMAFPLNEPTLVDWGVVIYLGVVQTSLAYVCLLRGLDHLRTIEATLLLLIEPVTAGIWAWLVHGEVPGSAALLGSGLIFAAVVFEAVQGSDDQVTSVGEQTE